MAQQQSRSPSPPMAIMSPELRSMEKRLGDLRALRDKDAKDFEERLAAEQESREKDLTTVWARMEYLEEQTREIRKARPSPRHNEQPPPSPSSILSSVLGTSSKAGDGKEGGEGGGGSEGGGKSSAELAQLQKEVEAARHAMASDKAALEQAAEAARARIAEAAEATRNLSGALQRAEEVRAGAAGTAAAAPSTSAEEARLRAPGSGRAGRGEGRRGEEEEERRGRAGAEGRQDGGSVQLQLDRLARELAALRAAVGEVDRKSVRQAMLAMHAALRAAALSPDQRLSALQELDLKARQSGIGWP